MSARRPVSRAVALAAVLGAIAASASTCGQDAVVPDCPGNEVPSQSPAGQWSCVPPDGAS